MTISSEVRKAGPFSANGSNKNFAFTFKCFTDEDVRVVLTNSLGVESDLMLDSDYSVTLNPDQNVSAGGTVITTLAYATGNKITLVGNVDYKQETDITNGGGFYPEVIENALDKLTMQVQQLNEAVDRSVKTDISSNENPADFLNSITDSVNEASASAAEAANQVTLAEAQVALAADQVELAADQVDLAADQVALAAGIFDQFDDRYLGSKSSDPALDNDGNALLTGALYWNTSQSRLKVYSGSGWVDTATAEPASFNHNIFSGNGSTTAFTLSNAPATLASMFVFISGVAQRPTTDYTIAGSVITFIPAPPTGTNNISVFVASTVAAGVPDDGSVSTAKLQNNSVTPAKMANGGAEFGMRNRIINGAMMIDQRNAGASVTPISGQYTLDRWRCFLTQSSKYTVQQNAGSVTPPVGFSNYLGVTSSSAYSLLAGDYFFSSQSIEGLNLSDLAWGTANAQTVTLSFWVRSSLTGTFGGSLVNGDSNRSYPFTYTISTANTWEQKTVTIVGDTTGTWLTTNGRGCQLRFSIGTGATYSGSAGSWASADYASATGATSVVGTNGATFYITGVQLEKGTQATAFEWRSYGTELALCQRYYQKLGNAVNDVYVVSQAINNGFTIGTTLSYVTKRATPTVTISGTWAVISCGQPSVSNSGINNTYINSTATNTAGQAAFASTALTSITISAEL